jgi:hypothetical protein
MPKKYCDHCGAEIITEKDMYWEADSGHILCTDCGDEQLFFSDDVQLHVHTEQYQEVYLDDDLSDVDFYRLVEPEKEV